MAKGPDCLPGTPKDGAVPLLLRKLILALAIAGPFWLQVPPTPAQPAVSMDEAWRIAAEHGVSHVEDISLGKDQWQVEEGDGTVTRMERERPASAKAGD